MWLFLVLSCSDPAPPPPTPLEDLAPPAPLEAPPPEAVDYLALREAADQAVDQASGLDAGLAFVDRYVLSGDIQDMVEALGRFDEAGGGGAARVEALLELHDVVGADTALRSTGSDAQRARAAMLRGDYRTAEELLVAAPSGLATARAKARLYRATGRPSQADAALAEALNSDLPPALAATVHAERAELDLDRRDASGALADLEALDAVMAGWWRADELRAQALMLSGDPDAALALLETWANAGQRPELIDVAAQATLAAGLPAKASTWAASALGDHHRRFEVAAAAAAGPLIGHWLTFEDGEPDQVLALAEEQARVLGDVTTLTLLAHTRLVTGDPSGAITAAERALASGASTRALHEVAAAAFRALGDGEAAAAQEAQAMRLRTAG